MKEYKIIKVSMDLGNKNIYEKIEETMEEMNKEGWEVVCMSPEPQSHTFKMLVTFCREKQ